MHYPPVCLVVTLVQMPQWPLVLMTPTTADLVSRPPFLTWARMTRMTMSLMKTMMTTKPIARSPVHRAQILSAALSEDRSTTLSFSHFCISLYFTLYLRRALKNTGFNGMSCCHPVSLSSGRAHHWLCFVSWEFYFSAAG